MDDIHDALTKIYPNGLTGKEITRRITEIYHAGYDLNNPDFDVYDQFQVCEVLEETQQKYREKNGDNRKNASVNGNDNGSYRFDVNSEPNWYKSELILKLKQCNSSTSPKEISFLLKEIFKYWLPPKGDHWLSVAQNFTARTLNWVMSATTKKYLQGGIKKNPAAYFTYLLRFRKMRKEFRGTNGSC